jgi:hypothetical protein
MLSAELQDLPAEDYDLSLVGFSEGELDKPLAFVPEGENEDCAGSGGTVPTLIIPEPPHNPASRTGDLWVLADHRLLCGDSTNHEDVRRLMNGERAVLFATDPPYLVDYHGLIAAAVADAITEHTAWYCWHSSRRQAKHKACWEKGGAFVHQQIIWVKDRGVLTRSHYL